MKIMDAYHKIKSFNLPIFRTNDIATYLQITTSHASHVLSRLAKSGQIKRIKHGMWVIPELIDPMIVPQYLTAPVPCYISLHSALYYHGMISQIPNTIYAVSLAKTKYYSTPLGKISIHHVDEGFFFGFNTLENGINMATSEKALLDFLYLSASKSRLFSALPELELPPDFSIKKANKIIQKIKIAKIKTLIERRFAAIIK
ncbi:MAG: type IV toxin-antitoxin system AbiEi family antitoxin domain-containing protein [Gammaproteobacteria bacterium]|jgi:predicted transcriptional regulator of viral defense system